MPLPLPLSSERLERHGLYLIEDGQTIFLWVGRDAVPQLMIDVFNLPSYDVLRGGKVCEVSRFISLESPLTLIHATRLPSLLWTTHSLNESTLSFKRLEKCAEDHITLTCIL